MKTTFDIPEPLLRDVQQLARERHTTAKSLVEQALIRLLDQARETAPYKLEDLSFAGTPGYTAAFTDATWDQIRDEAYRGRGA